MTLEAVSHVISLGWLIVVAAQTFSANGSSRAMVPFRQRNPVTYPAIHCDPGSLQRVTVLVTIAAIQFKLTVEGMGSWIDFSPHQGNPQEQHQPKKTQKSCHQPEVVR
jgi:hypothetical protein